MIRIKLGDIFESEMKTLVNTINCVGVMGKGIAKIYKDRYPKMFEEYKDMCTKKLIHTGYLYPYYEDNSVKILNFPTKQHWRSPSKLEYIQEGLNWFIQNYERLKITSIAFPTLGCGNGGLDWETVGPLMYQSLKDLPIDIEIYAPFGTEKSKLQVEFLLVNENKVNKTGVIYEKINNNWLLVLQLIKKLEESEYNIKVGRTIFQKICYVLSRYGTDIGVEFSKGTYGPYSADIKKIITILSNNNLIYEKEYGKMMLITVSKDFKIDKSLYSQKDIENVNKTFQLFKRVKDTNQAELITTILFSFDSLKETYHEVTENMIYQYILEWKKRFSGYQSELKIRELIKSLTGMNLIATDYTKDYVDDMLF